MRICADLHTHTIASTHAYSTITENCVWAKKNGIKAIAMTDHCGIMPDSAHIWHFENLRILPRVIEGTIVLKGVEANIINREGELDIPKSTLKLLEWVNISMHAETSPKGEPLEIAKTYINAMKNYPEADIISHPTTDNFYCDYETLVKGALMYEKIIEINESSVIAKRSSEKNVCELLKICKKYNAPVAVNTDSHFCQLIGKTSSALKIIEECEFPESLVINSDWEKFREFILRKRPGMDI